MELDYDSSVCDYNESGTVRWFDSRNNLHRIGGPAVEHTDGLKIWIVHDKIHRTDGPAIEDPEGHHEWWLDDIRYDPVTWMIKVHELGLK